VLCLIVAHVHCPYPKKVIELKSLIHSWLALRKVTKLQLQKLCGKLNWVSRVIRGGRTFTRNLLDLITKLKESHHHVRISIMAREDLLWWDKCFDHFHGKTPFSIDVPLPSFTFATDACERGGGAYFMNDWFYVSWSQDIPELCESHISVLELYTVYLSLKCWGPLLADSHVCVRSDSMSAVAALNKSTSRSKQLMPIVRENFWLSVRYNITVSSTHISGKLNVLSDRISRMDNLWSAMQARFILANFSPFFVVCKGHMTNIAFVWLQEEWIAHLRSYV
jgi:hypothetical protein